MGIKENIVHAKSAAEVNEWLEKARNTCPPETLKKCEKEALKRKEELAKKKGN
jgi:hypothetical protein